MKDWRFPLSVGILFGCLCTAAVVSAENRIITLGTGGSTGLYYPTGGAVCRLVNQTREDHGIRCAVRNTLGSIANLEQVSKGELDIAIAEAAQLYHDVRSKHQVVNGDRLTTLVSLYPEHLSVLANNDASIDSFDDLKGKRINIGKTGSSQRQTLSILMSGRNWSVKDFLSVLELEPEEQAAALCDRHIDATLYMVGHPSGAIKEAIRDCNSRLVSLSDRDISTLIEENSKYSKSVISGDLYGLPDAEIRTVSVNATLFSRADLPEETAYAIVKSLFTQFDDFKRMHPAFADLTPKEMLSQPLAAPLHPGALRYYQEAGLDQFIPQE